MLLLGGTFSVIDGHELTGVVSGVNALLLIHAVGTFIGWRHSAADLATQFRRARVLRHDVQIGTWTTSGTAGAHRPDDRLPADQDPGLDRVLCSPWAVIV